MLEVKEHLNTALEVLVWENLNVAQWKHYSSIETLLKQMNVASSVISLCSSIVLVLVPSC